MIAPRLRESDSRLLASRGGEAWPVGARPGLVASTGVDSLEKLQSALSGRYAVVREVGAGGMATVFLARDVKHDRHVALKVLRPELGAVLGVERFLSEIKVTAHLQHPHLLPLFDSGEADGLLFYVMPFVEGESLRTRLDSEQQLSIDEALRITFAVASALEYAHKQGVIHRDLKPENILLQHGEPVVSDFGIALAVSKAGGARVTQTGLSLGTPQYMSPEQATGDRVVDARSDIYSLGAVLYEMLTGEPPHAGKTAQAIIARVLTEKTNSMRVTRDTVPDYVDAAVLKALAKLPADRFASAGEFAAALRNPAFVFAGGTGTMGAIGSLANATGAAPGASFVSGPRGWWSRARPALPWAVAALAVGALALAKLEPDQPPAPVVRFTTEIPREVTFGAFNSPIAISPDGSAIVIGSMVQANKGLFIRTLDNPQFVPLPGTAGARSAFFSPDGSQVGFVASGQIRALTRSTGSVRTIASPATLDPVVTWSDRDELVYASSDSGTSGLWIVEAAGGAPRRLTAVDSTLKEIVHLAPHALPGGDAFLFTTALATSYNLAIVTRDGRITRFGVGGIAPSYVDGGLVVMDDFSGRLMRVPFDLRRAAPTGTPSIVLEGVAQRPSLAGLWAVSRNGTLVHIGGSPEGSLVIVNRSGAGVPLDFGVRRFRRPAVSPDGRRVVVEVATSSGLAAAGASPATDLWLATLAEGTFSRFTFGTTAMDPAWTNDGKRVAFSRFESGPGSNFDVYWQPADGSGNAEPLYQGSGSQWPYGFSADGRTMLLDENPVGGNIRIATAPVDGANRVATPLFESEGSARLGQLSADRKWIAYASNESGRYEVYVRPFPGPGGKWQVSADGGDQPLWNPNGREIFFRTGEKVISASVTTTPTFSVTGRRALFDDEYDQAGTLNWSVFPDGNRFVMVKPSAAQTRLMVAVNWTTELVRK